MAYMFRGVISDSTSMPPSVFVYWYFERVGATTRYVGHFDPRDGQDEPDWLVRARSIESCYDAAVGSCTESPWTYCADPSVTPRKNEEAELAGLWLSGSLVAPEDVYQMLLRDLATIRASYRDSLPVARIHFEATETSDWFRVCLYPDDYDRFEAGEYHDLDALNAFLRVTEVRHFGGTWLRLIFRGRYNPRALSDIYKRVPSVQLVTFEGPVSPDSDRGAVIPWRIP